MVIKALEQMYENATFPTNFVQVARDLAAARFGIQFQSPAVEAQLFDHRKDNPVQFARVLPYEGKCP